MTKYAKLIKIRGGHRAECTKLGQLIDATCEEDVPDRESLKELNEELCRQRDIIVKLDYTILENLEEEEDISEDVAEASRISRQINKLVRKVSKFLLPEMFNKQDIGSTKNVKLPTIVLPKFGGSALEWQNFWDLYRGAIHERTDISDAAKFHYLLSQLIGEASQLMAGFSHTNAEYSEAITLLIETYGKPAKLIEAHIHAIIDLQSPRPTAKNLSNFRSNYEGHLRGLKTLDVKVDEAGFLFT